MFTRFMLACFALFTPDILIARILRKEEDRGEKDPYNEIDQVIDLDTRTVAGCGSPGCPVCPGSSSYHVGSSYKTAVDAVMAYAEELEEQKMQAAEVAKREAVGDLVTEAACKAAGVPTPAEMVEKVLRDIRARQAQLRRPPSGVTKTGIPLRDVSAPKTNPPAGGAVLPPMQSIPRPGDYRYKGPETPKAPTEQSTVDALYDEGANGPGEGGGAGE